MARPVWSETIDPGQAANAFNERQALCARDESALWGQDLCGPLLFVDPQTRSLVANQNTTDEFLRKDNGVFVGTLPENVAIGNTALEWKGVRWSMVMWPLPESPASRGDLLMHESWHRIQDSLGLPPSNPNCAHLATDTGRTWMRMEWRALGAALTAQNDLDRRRAIGDALTFRALRRQRLKGATETENALELHEGMAEYTGRRLSGQDNSAVAAAVAAADRGTSFVRSFAYASGPAYGFLLDGYGGSWRKQLTLRSDLGELLAHAADVAEPVSPMTSATSRGTHYGLARVQREEAATAREQRRQAREWTRQLIAGPLLHLGLDAKQVEFDPRTLFPLPPHGTVFPRLKVIDHWGTLTVDGGALLDEKWSLVTVAAPRDAAAMAGKGWTLQLNPGWAMSPGKRTGDFVVTRTDR
jgi:hypothetical protein